MPRLINEFQQFFDRGEPLANGLLYFYESGSSSVAKETYLDSAESIANSNPVKLNGDGRCPNVFGSGVYNVIVRTSSGEQIQARDPVGGSSTLGFGSAWDAQTVYSLAFVVFSSGKYWQSLISSNVGNVPIEGAIWTEVDLTSKSFYIADVNYVVNSRAIGGDGNIYKCLISNGPATTIVDPVGDVSGTWIADGGIGVNQTRINYSSSGRTLGVTYTNSTGKPRFVDVTLQDVNPGSNATLVVTINGNIHSRIDANAAASANVSKSFVVQDGESYSVTGSAADNILYWWELN